MKRTDAEPSADGPDHQAARTHAAPAVHDFRRSASFAIGLGAEGYVLSLLTRVMILGLAAMSLDLILGYGALVSFGHAAFLGIGAYAVGILAGNGIDDLVVQIPVALAASAAFAPRHRGDFAAHQGRLFHHDHAGLRPDAVLPRHIACSLWRG